MKERTNNAEDGEGADKEDEKMTRFHLFTDEELDAIESALCDEGWSCFDEDLIAEIRREKRYREVRKRRTNR